jgi:hypothetical protein
MAGRGKEKAADTFWQNFWKLALTVMMVFWLIVVWEATRGWKYTPVGDYQRDTAITFNVLHGNFLGDPAYLGEHAWYPFLEETVFAVFHLLTGIPVQELYVSFPFLVTVPILALVAYVALRLYRSWAAVFTFLFLLIFSVSWTAWNLHITIHPDTVAFGTMALAIYLFWLATTKEILRYWVLAGVGIALVIISQTIAAMIICGGFAFYQLWQRTRWREFFVMVGTAFVLTAPYVLPFILVYHLTARNLYGLPYLDYLATPDFFFFGIGYLRWFNVFFIITGLVLAVLKRRPLDKILLCLFFVSLAGETIGFWKLYGPRFGLPAPAVLPEFVPQDFQVFNHFVAVFFLVTGLFWAVKMVAGRIRRNYQVVLAGLLAVYAIPLVPNFVKVVDDRREYLAERTNHNTDWLAVSDWILTQTKIDDVFLAHPDIAYVFISGATGRKVVVTEDAHANTFVNQDQHKADFAAMSAATDLAGFWPLARKCRVTYVVVSAYEAGVAPDGMRKYFENKDFFIPVYSSPAGVIFRVNWEKVGPPK